MSEESSQSAGLVTRRVRSGISKLLSRVLPTRTKRLILFASLSARFCDDKAKFDSATLHKLNSIMVLSSSDQALSLPMHLSKVIWKGDSGNTLLYPTKSDTEAPGEDVINTILNEIPVWLRYSNKKGMREDLERLISHRNLIAS